MSEFTREIKIYPSYDHRDEPDDQRGAQGCDLMLILRGPLGAIAARISTGWMADPLVGRYVRGAGKQRRLGKPGVDAGVADCYPSGTYVGSHYLKRRGEYDVRKEECEYLNGAECYGDGSYVAADEVLLKLTTGGSDAAFEHLEHLYQVWIVEEPKEETDEH